jgi:hypothetical protein
MDRRMPGSVGKRPLPSQANGGAQMTWEVVASTGA